MTTARMSFDDGATWVEFDTRSYRERLLGELRLLEAYDVSDGERDLPVAFSWTPRSTVRVKAPMLRRFRDAGGAFDVGHAVRRTMRRYTERMLETFRAQSSFWDNFAEAES